MQPRHLHDANFRTELDRLNAAQRAAVEQIDGPVMVLAGPGTGKTHLLAARIGNILTETDTGAHNILCLTFTEAGVKAMRERLLQFIGPEAHRIGIFTFHGFCSNLIQQNLQYFGKPDLEPLGELEQIRIIRRMLDELKQDTPLRQGYHDNYFYEPHLKHLFSAIKAENWDVDDVEQKINRYLESLPTHPEFTYQRKYADNAKGDPKTGQIAEETLRMERLRAGIHLFPAYQEALRKERRYDYGDMIGWVLRAFNDFPSLLRAYQERYQYVLVDEFQDTNGAQDMIVRSLVDYWERPNVFIVGDDDQAIYEFQGARLRSMTDFFQRYDNVRLVTLTENYRSRQEILDVASTLIRKNELRIGNKLPGLSVEKKLVASHPDFLAGTRVRGEVGGTDRLPPDPSPPERGDEDARFARAALNASGGFPEDFVEGDDHASRLSPGPSPPERGDEDARFARAEQDEGVITDVYWSVEPGHEKIILDYAKQMRKNPTPAEKTLWRHLRADGVGHKVYRQKPMGYSIGDFVFPVKRVVVEIDGAYHQGPKMLWTDEQRDLKFARVGYTTLRFTNDEVLKDPFRVVNRIKEVLDSRADRPYPFPREIYFINQDQAPRAERAATPPLSRGEGPGERRHEQATQDTSSTRAERAATPPLSRGEGPGERRHEQAISLLTFPDPHQETAYLINQLRAWHASGVPWSEMAIIYAKHGQAAELRHLLERADIPYRSKRRPNVLDGRPVRQLLDLLTYLQAEYHRPGTGEYLLFRVLHFRCFGLWPHDLARLNRARLAAKDADGLFSTWREFLQTPERWPTDLRDGDAIQLAADWLEDMIGEIGLYPLTEYVERAMNGSGLLPGVLRHPNRAELLQHLATFADFAAAEVARRPRLLLSDLLETLQQMDANRLQLPLRSHLDQAEAVLLVTAHSAKGLEFDKVWMLDCAESKWGKSGGANNQFKLPDTLTYTGAESEEEARRRLFYVAITRAKTGVVMSVADQDNKGKAQQRVSFLDELVAEAGLIIEPAGLTAEETATAAALQLQPTDLTRLPGLETSAIAELLKDFRLSVSALYSYLDCPTRFFYEKLLGVPDLEREQTLYGSALHDALETYFLRMKRDTSNVFPSKAELLFNFEQALGKRRGLFSPQGFDNRLRQGRQELAGYHDAYRKSWTTDVDVELLIRNVEVDGIPLVGMIDRVDILSDAWVRVVDYKTSGSGKSVLPAKLKGPTKSKPEGGNYWRQLNFYKLLYDNRPGNLRRVKEGKISFLLVNSAGEQPEVTVSMGPKDQEQLRAIMRQAWDGIQAQQFTGCGKDECAWCRFVADLREEVPVGLEEDEVDDRT